MGHDSTPNWVKWSIILTDRGDTPPPGLSTAAVEHIFIASSGDGPLTPMLPKILRGCTDHALCMVEAIHAGKRTTSLLVTTPVAGRVASLAWLDANEDKGMRFPDSRTDPPRWRFSLDLTTVTTLDDYSLSQIFYQVWTDTDRSYIPEDYRIQDGLLRCYRGNVNHIATIHTLGGGINA